MNVWTLAWSAWAALGVALELVAYSRGGYWATCTGRLVAAMLANPWLFVGVPLVFVGVAVHLWADALVVRLK